MTETTSNGKQPWTREEHYILCDILYDHDSGTFINDERRARHAAARLGRSFAAIFDHKAKDLVEFSVAAPRGHWGAWHIRNLEWTLDWCALAGVDWHGTMPGDFRSAS